MRDLILTLGLSISVLTNCISLWRLMKELNQQSLLESRISELEWKVEYPELFLWRKYGSKFNLQ